MVVLFVMAICPLGRVLVRTLWYGSLEYCFSLSSLSFIVCVIYIVLSAISLSKWSSMC